MTVKEVERLTGVSVRTLHHYDKIGLLRPSRIRENGYRDYSEEDLLRLSQILLYRELKFSLRQIADILDSPDYDRNRVLTKQIGELTRQRQHIDNLITFAVGIRGLGVKHVDFSVFDARCLDEYAEQAKLAWSEMQRQAPAKQNGIPEHRPEDDEMLTAIFRRFGEIRTQPAESETARAAVRALRDYITAHCWPYTDEMLLRLGEMFAGGGTMTEEIDKAGGTGTAEYVRKAIRAALDMGEK